jgi:hypothetical protein
VLTVSECNAQFEVKITDSVYNNFREILKDGSQMSLRMHCPWPTADCKTVRRNHTSYMADPVTDINPKGFNPAMERRLHYKLLHLQSGGKACKGQAFININYLLDHPTFETAYRCDVQNVETKNKLSLKPSEDDPPQDQFCHIETSYKKLRAVMLYSKFDPFFQQRIKTDNKEMAKLKKKMDHKTK